MKPGASVCGVATRRHSFLVLLTEAHFVTLRASPPPRSFAPTDGRTMWAFRPARYHCRADRRPRVRSGRAAVAALLQIITRDFLTISAVRVGGGRACDVGACAADGRGGERERKGAAARDHRHHLLNGKKRTWPQSIRTKQRSCHFWPYDRPIHLSIWFSFHITAAAGSDPTDEAPHAVS